ncbi:MAG: hypothetical protein GX372_01020 [Ignavibacteria bacterium]|nr:hypothetical protein [Ignavibacteria bacterium]
MKKLGFLFLGLCFLFVSCGEENVKNNSVVSHPIDLGGNINSYTKIVPKILSENEVEVMLFRGTRNYFDMPYATKPMNYLHIEDFPNEGAVIIMAADYPMETYKINRIFGEEVKDWDIPEDGMPVIITGEPIKIKGVEYDYYTSEKVKKDGYIISISEQMDVDSTMKKVERKIPINELVIPYDFNLTSIRKK